MSKDNLRIERKSFNMLNSVERDGWVRLLRESTVSRWAFLSPTYAEAVNATLGPVDVLLCWRGSELVGVMPMQRAAGWLGRLGLMEPVGREMTDYFGLLAQHGVEVNWRILLNGAGIPCLFFTHLDESQVTHGLSGESPEKGLRCYVHADGGEAHWEMLRHQDRKLINDTERRQRKLIAEHGPLEFQVNSATPLQDMASLVELKNSQYRRTGQDGGALLTPGNVQLINRLMASCDPDCQPRLSVLRCGGQLIAAHFGLQCGTVLHYWFPAYDINFANYSPGRILFRYMLLNAWRINIDCIDRGQGDSAYKREFANNEHRYFKGLVSSGNWGQTLMLIQRLWWRVV